jgi:hypothetical protein
MGTRSNWYAVLPCWIERYHGIDLAIHNFTEEGLIATANGIPKIYANPKRWACSDPLTGCELFVARVGESRYNFEQNIRHKVIPALEAERKMSWAQIVYRQRMKLKPAPHPSRVKEHITEQP